jgi:phosphohistidine phosphatase
MKLLYLLRHAKSSWDDLGLADHDRPLAPRGRHAAELMAAHLKSERMEPQLVLCSSARRTRETLERVAPGGEVSIEAGLYGATHGAIVERLRGVPETVGSVMVIGHNPAMQSLVLDLTGTDRKFPTGALATIEFDGPWNGLAAGGGRLADFVRPKALPGGSVR